MVSLTFWKLRTVAALVLATALIAAVPEHPRRLVPPDKTIPPTFFGMHMHHAGDTTPLATVRFGEWRLWDASVAWPDIEPRRDEWKFEQLDQYLDLAEEHHVGMLLVLGLTPGWASTRPKEKSAYQPGFAAPPKTLDDWRVYVRTVAQRYKGRIEAYEIWNEPDLRQSWSGTVEEMVELTRITSEVIRGVDPEAKLVAPSVTSESGIRWLAQFLSKGGGKEVDVVGYHFYVAPKPPEEVVPLIERVRGVMKSGGGGEMPLWDTELGWSGPKPFPSEGLGAAYLARTYILSWAAGVERVYWCSWDDHARVALDTTKPDDRTMTAAGRSYDVVVRWLAGATMKECGEDREHTWICSMEREGSREWIVWNSGGAKTFSVPAQWGAVRVQPLLGEARSVAGASIDVGAAPVLVSGK
jgi:Glycosyl hydrolases family 39